jgi:hypothetical protein
MVKAAIKPSSIVKKRTKKFVRHQSDKYDAVDVCISIIVPLVVLLFSVFFS